MASFTYDDALLAVRQQLNDAAGRRFKDADMLAYIVPRALQQLYADRPDLFVGSEGTVNFKPAQTDPCAFDDAGFDTFVEAVMAQTLGAQKEEVNRQSAAAADARAQRDRRS